MDTVWYEGPSGNEFVPNPTAELMCEVLRREYGSYWGPYSPVGLLEWHRHPPQEVPTRIGLGTATHRSQLLFIAHPERGWYIEWDDRVPYNPAADRGEWVEHWACGEPVYLLAACFVPLGVAEQVVAEFLAAGHRPAVVSWAGVATLGARLSPDQWREQRQAEPGAAPDTAARFRTHRAPGGGGAGELDRSAPAETRDGQPHEGV